MVYQSSCDEIDAKTLSVEEALERVLHHINPVTGIEYVETQTALNRVLANDIHAPFNIPPHSNSAMDGYALRAEATHTTSSFRVIGEALAGHPFEGTVNPGECVQVMTGAVIPKDTDTVVPQEHVSVAGDLIHLEKKPSPQSNIRYPGEDLSAGACALKVGKRIDSAELGLLASLGLKSINVFRLPKVAYFSTGDELREPGEALEPGTIYDSNRPTLRGLLSNIGVELIDYGCIKDDIDALRRTLTDASHQADIIIATGGASVGTADHVTHLLRKQGEAHFWKIAMKPGRPLNFGRFNQTLLFGLPGNPVSVMVTFSLFVNPALRRLRGEPYFPPIVFRAITRTPLRKTVGRADYQRGILRQSENGGLEVAPTGIQSSHILSGMSQANCLIRLPCEAGPIDAGSTVDVIPFNTLFR
ncbi:molybdopterin molybdotransferase MoeA [Acidihalobacter prosperus]